MVRGGTLEVRPTCEKNIVLKIKFATQQEVDTKQRLKNIQPKVRHDDKRSPGQNGKLL